MHINYVTVYADVTSRHGSGRRLALGQDYVVILKLILPESDINKQVA